MFRFFYILATQSASALLPIAALFSTKVKRFSHERITSKKPKTGKVKFWIHAASLGEYEMALPLIEKLLLTNKLDDILITLFSPSGYLQAVKGPFAERIIYLPLDTVGKVKQFYEEYAPQKAIFVRYDFWYNFINEGQRRGVKFYLINGRFQENHFFFKFYGKPYLKLLIKFKGVYTSDKHSESVLIEHGVKAEFIGDSRFDRVSDIAKRAKKHSDIEVFIGNRKVLMLGSSWEPEEELVLFFLKNKPENLTIIIAPHDLKRCDSIAQKLKEFSPKKYTDSSFSNTDQVLILDTMGMLSSMYQYADFALVGGGFSGALHNILEPAVWGCHLSYGPHNEKFPEAQAFVEAGFATSIEDRERWVEEISILISNPTLLNAVKTKSKNYTAENIGTTSRITSSLL